jgi:transcriptional regulator with XRE-family HTH domain
MARMKRYTPRKGPVALSRTEKRFVTYLKFHRMRLGLTQEKLARKARISQGHLSDIESGRVKPHPEIHKRLAEALERPMDEFTAKLYGVSVSDMMAGAR